MSASSLLLKLADPISGLPLMARLLDLGGFTDDQSNPNVAAMLTTWAAEAAAATMTLPDEVIKHKYIEMECGDHYIEACGCGVNRDGYLSDADHAFSWEQHIKGVF